jgi:quercetin 2,3-dioxygenase
MEIVTYVLAGALEHKDSMGNGQVLRPGEFQRMSAGTGITHSEFNPSSTQPVHLYQIWIKPGRKGITPSYEQKHFDEASSCNQLQLVASPGGDSGSLMIHQDVHIYLMNLEKGKQFTMNITPERHVWLQVLHGEVTLNGEKLSASDGAAVSEEALLSMETALDAEAELLLFDLA